MKIFIPIKQNSQRVPRKNFRIFRGTPLYKYVLRKYNKHSVFVDTDSDQIINECKTDPTLEHVTAYKRDVDLCGDTVSVCDLLLNFIDKFNIKDPIVQTHVTSPFMNIEILKDAYDHLNKHDSVISCNVYNSRFWREEKYGYCPINHNPLKLEQTQDLPKLYEENSAFYIFKPEVLVKIGNRIGKNPFFYSIDRPYNLDIDTESDWEMVTKEAHDES